MVEDKGIPEEAGQEGEEAEEAEQGEAAPTEGEGESTTAEELDSEPTEEEAAIIAELQADEDEDEDEDGFDVLFSICLAAIESPADFNFNLFKSLVGLLGAQEVWDEAEAFALEGKDLEIENDSGEDDQEPDEDTESDD